MCLQVRDALTVGSISLSSHFFSIKMDVKDALKALGNEMRAFAILVEPPKTTFGKVRKTYSGKVGGEQDDACIAMQLAVTGLRCAYTDSNWSPTPSLCGTLTPTSFPGVRLLYIGKVTLLHPQTSHTLPTPNHRLPQQVRALPTHEQAHDGLKRLRVLTPAELCVDAVAVLWLLWGNCLARGQSLYPSRVPRCNVCRQVTIPLLSVAPYVFL